MTLDQKIEGYLFFKAEPVAYKELAGAFNVQVEHIHSSIEVLKHRLLQSGLVLVEHENAIMLGTKPELGPLFESIRKEELSSELSRASVETLSIILYKSGVTRSEIDYIRGVNSGFILRNLLVRGLIEKETDSRDSRKYVYKPTFDMLGQLGIGSIQDLPRYSEIHEALVAGDVGNSDTEQAEEEKQPNPEA